MRLNSSLYAFLNNLLNLLPGFGRSNTVRGWLARMALKGCGRKLKVSSNVHIFNAQNMTVGDNVYVGCCCYFGGGEIVLEDEVSIGPFVTVAAGNHTMQDGSYRFGPYEFGRIRVGRGTWLCANTVITSGVTIGKGCVVAAGSVVTKDVPDYSVVGGIPARLIKTVTPEIAEALRAQK
jgi:maltose O-acetyltransferase